MDEEGANQKLKGRDLPLVIGSFALTHVSFPSATLKFGTLSASDSYMHCLVHHAEVSGESQPPEVKM